MTFYKRSRKFLFFINPVNTYTATCCNNSCNMRRFWRRGGDQVLLVTREKWSFPSRSPPRSLPQALLVIHRYRLVHQACISCWKRNSSPLTDSLLPQKFRCYVASLSSIDILHTSCSSGPFFFFFFVCVCVCVCVKVPLMANLRKDIVTLFVKFPRTP